MKSERITIISFIILIQLSCTKDHSFQILDNSSFSHYIENFK